MPPGGGVRGFKQKTPKGGTQRGPPKGPRDPETPNDTQQQQTLTADTAATVGLAVETPEIAPYNSPGPQETSTKGPPASEGPRANVNEMATAAGRALQEGGAEKSNFPGAQNQTKDSAATAAAATAAAAPGSGVVAGMPLSIPGKSHAFAGGEEGGTLAWGSTSGVHTLGREAPDMSSSEAWPLRATDCVSIPTKQNSSLSSSRTTSLSGAPSCLPCVSAGGSSARVSVVSSPEGPPKPHQMPTRQIWLLVVSVLLTWVQDPLLSLLASAAAARLQQGAPLAVVGVGAGGQAPDGLCLLLAALGQAVSTLCSRSHKINETPHGSSKGHGAPGGMWGALRVAAVGAWLAAGVGVALASALYAGSERLLSFFLTIKGAAAAAAAASGEQQVQQHGLALAVAFVKIRCLSLPFSIVTLTAKASLLTFRDAFPQLTTIAVAGTAAPLFFFFANKASAAATPEEAAASFVTAAAWTVVTVQVAAALLLLLRLGTLATTEAEQQEHQQQQQHSVLRRLHTLYRLYRPPLWKETKAFAPFVLPVLTQCCVRMILYSSMTKAASLWGPKAMAAHQLSSGLYTVLGMPADTMAQVVNAAMPKGPAATPTASRRLERRIFKVAACTAVLSAAAQMTIVAFLACRLEETDFQLSQTVLFTGGCASVPLLFLPFASTMEGLLLLDLRGSTVATAYAATLPAPLLAMVVAERGAAEMQRIYFRTDTPAFVCCLWLLPLVYNVMKLAVMGFSAPRAGIPLSSLLLKESPV